MLRYPSGVKDFRVSLFDALPFGGQGLPGVLVEIQQLLEAIHEQKHWSVVVFTKGVEWLAIDD